MARCIHSTTNVLHSAGSLYKALEKIMSETFIEDMNIVREIMDGFLSQEHISKGLQQINDIGITGWE